MRGYQATRYHDISCGHRVYGHEGKCRYLHGHNYRIHFVCATDRLDEVGRVLDFSVINEKLCQWLEREWDHKFLLWDKDPWSAIYGTSEEKFGIVRVPFNPTAENIAWFLVEAIAPVQLKDTGVVCVKVVVEETRKCSASYER